MALFEGASMALFEGKKQRKELVSGVARFDVASVRRARDLFQKINLQQRNKGMFVPSAAVIKQTLDRAHLTPVRLGSLVVDEVAEGHFIDGYIAAPSTRFFTMAAVMVVDKQQHKAVMVLLANTIVSSDSERDIQEMFPEGARVAIKEPLLSNKGPAGIFIFLDNPQALEVVSIFPELTSTDADELRSLGNREFKAKRYHAAVELYSRSISVASSSQHKLLGYTNRAEAKLQLGEYEKAVNDASMALELEPLHAKSLARKARALQRLGQYSEACDCFAAASAMDEYEQCLEFKHQSMLGSHDLAGYVAGGPVPEFADYVGPVDLRMSACGRGRGLFVTRDVKVGELLLVCTSSAVNEKMVENRFHKLENNVDMQTRLIRACIKSWRLLLQVYSMADDSTDLDSREVPPMHIFQPNCGLVKPDNLDAEHVDVVRIAGVLSINQDTFAKSYTVSCSSGLFTLSSLMNHSCLPNVSTLEVGSRTLFMFAAKDITSGSELLRSYKRETLVPGDCGEDHYGCERCSVQQSLGGPMAKIRERYESCLETANRKAFEKDKSVSQEKLNEDFIQVALDVEQLLARSSSLSDAQKQWMRVMYCNAYSTYYALADGRYPQFPTMLVFAKALAEHAAASERVILVLNGLRVMPASGYSQQILPLLVRVVRGTFGNKLVGDGGPDVVNPILKFKYQMLNNSVN